MSVPVPDDSSTVIEAVMEGLLLRGRDPEQLTLDVGFEKRDELHLDWESAAERERSALT